MELQRIVDALTEFRQSRPRTAMAVAVVGGLAVTGVALYVGHQNVFVHSESYCYALSRTFFEFSLRFNSIRYGSAFGHQRIGDDRPSDIDHSQIAHITDDSKLVHFYDRAEHASSPIILSGIPRVPEHIAQLRDAYSLQRVTFYTLNLAFERQRAGLDALLAHDADLDIRLYPTTDFFTPSLVDLVRAVRDLRARDAQRLAVVHCKAGRGRSTAVVAAYILAELPQLPVVEVEAYIRSKRPQVKLGRAKRAALASFVEQMQQAGSFELLLDSVADQIAERELALQLELQLYN